MQGGVSGLLRKSPSTEAAELSDLQKRPRLSALGLDRNLGRYRAGESKTRPTNFPTKVFAKTLTKMLLTTLCAKRFGRGSRGLFSSALVLGQRQSHDGRASHQADRFASDSRFRSRDTRRLGTGWKMVPLVAF